MLCFPSPSPCPHRFAHHRASSVCRTPRRRLGRLALRFCLGRLVACAKRTAWCRGASIQTSRAGGDGCPRQLHPSSPARSTRDRRPLSQSNRHHASNRHCVQNMAFFRLQRFVPTLVVLRASIADSQSPSAIQFFMPLFSFKGAIAPGTRHQGDHEREAIHSMHLCSRVGPPPLGAVCLLTLGILVADSPQLRPFIPFSRMGLIVPKMWLLSTHPRRHSSKSCVEFTASRPPPSTAITALHTRWDFVDIRVP